MRPMKITPYIKPGVLLYDVHSTKAGNTTISVEGVWVVRVISTHFEEDVPYAVCSWNGNKPRKYYRRDIEKLRRHPKEWVRDRIFGERTCYYCHASESDGHTDKCEHPRAKRGRS